MKKIKINWNWQMGMAILMFAVSGIQGWALGADIYRHYGLLAAVLTVAGCVVIALIVIKIIVNKVA